MKLEHARAKKKAAAAAAAFFFKPSLTQHPDDLLSRRVEVLVSMDAAIANAGQRVFLANASPQRPAHGGVEEEQGPGGQQEEKQEGELVNRISLKTVANG